MGVNLDKFGWPRVDIIVPKVVKAAIVNATCRRSSKNSVEKTNKVGARLELFSLPFWFAIVFFPRERGDLLFLTQKVVARNKLNNNKKACLGYMYDLLMFIVAWPIEWPGLVAEYWCEVCRSLPASMTHHCSIPDRLHHQWPTRVSLQRPNCHPAGGPCHPARH